VRVEVRQRVRALLLQVGRREERLASSHPLRVVPYKKCSSVS
jgi:hypothetical protein